MWQKDLERKVNELVLRLVWHREKVNIWSWGWDHNVLDYKSFVGHHHCNLTQRAHRSFVIWIARNNNWKFDDVSCCIARAASRVCQHNSHLESQRMWQCLRVKPPSTSSLPPLRHMVFHILTHTSNQLTALCRATSMLCLMPTCKVLLDFQPSSHMLRSGLGHVQAVYLPVMTTVQGVS